MLTILASTLAVSAETEKDAVVDNTSNNLRGRALGVSALSAAGGWAALSEKGYLYKPLAINNGVTQSGGTLDAFATFAYMTNVEVDGVMVQFDTTYAFTNLLDSDVRMSYRAGTDGVQQFTVVNGDKTVKVKAMKSKIKEIKINGQNGSLNEWKALKKINRHIENIGLAMGDARDFLWSVDDYPLASQPFYLLWDGIITSVYK